MVRGLVGLHSNFFSSSLIFLAGLALESWRDLTAVLFTSSNFVHQIVHLFLPVHLFIIQQSGKFLLHNIHTFSLIFISDFLCKIVLVPVRYLFTNLSGSAAILFAKFFYLFICCIFHQQFCMQNYPSTGTGKAPNFDRVFMKNIFYSIFLIGGPLWKKSTEHVKSRLITINDLFILIKAI